MSGNDSNHTNWVNQYSSDVKARHRITRSRIVNKLLCVVENIILELGIIFCFVFLAAIVVVVAFCPFYFLSITSHSYNCARHVLSCFTRCNVTLHTTPTFTSINMCVYVCKRYTATMRAKIFPGLLSSVSYSGQYCSIVQSASHIQCLYHNSVFHFLFLPLNYFILK